MRMYCASDGHWNVFEKGFHCFAVPPVRTMLFRRSSRDWR